MCSKCLNEELLFCAPIPAPKKKLRLKRNKQEEKTVGKLSLLEQELSSPAKVLNELIHEDISNIELIHEIPRPSSPHLMITNLSNKAALSCKIRSLIVSQIAPCSVSHVIGSVDNEVMETLLGSTSSNITLVLVLRSENEAVKQGIEEMRSLCVLLRRYEHKLSKVIAIRLNDHLPSNTKSLWRQMFLPRDVDDEDRRKSYYDRIMHSSMSAVDSDYNKYIFICSHKKRDVQMGFKSLQELLNIF